MLAPVEVPTVVDARPLPASPVDSVPAQVVSAQCWGRTRKIATLASLLTFCLLLRVGVVRPDVGNYFSIWAEKVAGDRAAEITNVVTSSTFLEVLQPAHTAMFFHGFQEGMPSNHTMLTQGQPDGLWGKASSSLGPAPPPPDAQAMPTLVYCNRKRMRSKTTETCTRAGSATRFMVGIGRQLCRHGKTTVF